jgi:energy-coupling factor transport system ATP-binding protein
MIQLNQVTIRYPGRTEPALRDVTVILRSGESVCLMGGNGSGKSTLALVLAGVLKPESGEVLIDGQSIDRDKSARMGIVFQNPDNQMVATIVEKELVFSLENLATPQAEMETELERSADEFKLRSLLRSATTRLSGGEQQRVALAAVMITAPPLLILDEPDSFLDAAGRAILRDALAGIRSRHPDLVEVRISQDIETARRYARLIVLDRGVIVADGSPDEILSDTPLLNRCRLVVDEVQISQTTSGIVDWFQANGGGPAEVAFDKVSFGYDSGRMVLQDVDLSISRGQILGVAGPTGSGKTTLGLLLSGIFAPTSGRITGQLNGEGKIGRPCVTMAMQQPERQFFLPTCSAEIAFGPSNVGRPLEVSQIDRLLELVGLPATEFRERDPLSLSIGEQRRLACAVMLGLRKPFVVYDEPTAGLDADGIARFVSLVRRIKAGGGGQVIISHDHRLLAELSDHVLTLDHEGRAVTLDPARFGAQAG